MNKLIIIICMHETIHIKQCEIVVTTNPNTNDHLNYRFYSLETLNISVELLKLIAFL